MTSTQANGFFGAFLKFAGYDAIVLQGVAPAWSYLYIHDGKVEIRNATGILDKNSYLYIHDDNVELRDTTNLIGRSTYEVDTLIKRHLGKDDREISILSIGPAGENLVKFACIFTDKGHIAAHNGVGAVMGSKKVKAIVITRNKSEIPLKDPPAVLRISKELRELAFRSKPASIVEGTLDGIAVGTALGFLPVKNYTTGINTMNPDILRTYSAQSIRETFGGKPHPCWACAGKHCYDMKIKEGKYAGREFEEPEYEGVAACSSLLGIQDVTMSLVLSSEIDRLGMDINETGYLIAWVLECYEEKLITQKDTDGLDLTWGNGEAIMALLNNIARRRGFGNLLAEGVKRASASIGKEAQKLAIYTLKGNSPRGHDHRVQWLELFDTCVSNLGTLEAHASSAPYLQLGVSRPTNGFDPIAVSTCIAQIKGAMVFEDSMVTCRFNTNANLELMCQAVNAATGWNINIQDAMAIGRRAVNLARVYNLRCGITAEMDAPSLRYGSTPLDGIGAGKGILPHWDKMLRNYYHLMGWDEDTGKPQPQTLKNLELQNVIPHIWT
jgi:aldehyde:ferredoxin oxidoreductase